MKKDPHFAWTILGDVGQVLCMQETLVSSCYCTVVANRHFLELVRTFIYDFWRRFAHRELARNICQGLPGMSVLGNKRLRFRQVTLLFIVSSRFKWPRDIWPMIDYLGAI